MVIIVIVQVVIVAVVVLVEKSADGNSIFSITVGMLTHHRYTPPHPSLSCDCGSNNCGECGGAGMA